MADYLSLDEAAAKLGIPTDRLVALRSQGQIRGFRDGSSWKFPEGEIERLADELADSAGGSGILVNDSDLGALGSSSGNIIGGDTPMIDEAGSDLELGGESIAPGSSGSDVNLVASEGEGSDVAIVASDADLLKESAGTGLLDSDILLEDNDLIDSGSGLLEIDSAELKINDPALMHDSAQLDLAIEPNAGNSGIHSDHDVLSGGSALGSGIGSGMGSGSMLDIGGELDDLKLNNESDLSFSGLAAAGEDKNEEVIGGDSGEVLNPNASGIGSHLGSSLELMDELDSPNDGGSEIASLGGDVLSELDLLGSDPDGSGLISGDSENLLQSSGLGSSIGVDGLKDSDLVGLDDALADDDDLVIADDDDDLIISNAGNDISVAGDSGINLMSPSDSGLSLESEPLDLAGSSISALDLGAELSDVDNSGSDGSMVDFQADEEFQLSPSGVGLDADIESESQVIEVEDSEAIGEAVEFDDAGFGDAGFDNAGGFDQDAGFGDNDAFAAEVEGEALAIEDADEAVAIDDSIAPVARPSAIGAYEIPFTLFQCLTLMTILFIMSLGGMLMTDLVRNMWTYTEPAAPVSSLTDSLVSLMGWGQ